MQSVGVTNVSILTVTEGGKKWGVSIVLHTTCDEWDIAFNNIVYHSVIDIFRCDYDKN